MQIIELGDCSMVIMKDSDDPPWVSMGNAYRDAVRHRRQITVSVHSQGRIVERTASEAVCTSGKLILYFQESLEGFRPHDKVELF